MKDLRALKDLTIHDVQFSRMSAGENPVWKDACCCHARGQGNDVADTHGDRASGANPSRGGGPFWGGWWCREHTCRVVTCLHDLQASSSPCVLIPALGAEAPINASRTDGGARRAV